MSKLRGSGAGGVALSVFMDLDPTNYTKQLKRERTRNREKARETRLKVLQRYGAFCHCCKESRQEFLCIDHVLNDGAEERKKKMYGGSFYNWLLKQPHDLTRYQVLCHNCNMAKGFYGYCPHQREHEITVKETT